MKRVGVLGTFVWDTIWHPSSAGRPPVEQLGGVAYSLAAFAAACPPGWSIFPLTRIGADLAGAALDFTAALSNVGSHAGMKVVPEPNNRVELRYADGAERTERPLGGVSGWPAAELLPIAEGLDALYVNFLAGNEIDLSTALALRASLDIPIYADLHSLFLGAAHDGPRPPHRLTQWAEWLRCFDIVQLNETELRLLGPERNDALSLLPDLPALGPELVVVTRGGEGASFAWRTSQWPVRGLADDGSQGAGGRLEQGELPLSAAPLPGDPTGCGDVWGSVTFCGLLDGLAVEDAVGRGHSAAAAKMGTRQIDQLEKAISHSLRPG